MGPSTTHCWQHRRYWHAPLPHALLQAALAAPEQHCVRTQAMLGHPSVAYLRDCMVGPSHSATTQISDKERHVLRHMCWEDNAIGQYSMTP